MTNDELDQIEARLAISLPPEYRQFAANYPADLDADIRAHDIYDRAETVISATERLRLRPIPEMPWSDSYVVIGDSGCGDWYFLDLDESPAPLKWWNHETAAIEQVAFSIREWHAKVIRDE